MKRLSKIGLIAIATTLAIPAGSWGQAIPSVDAALQAAEAERHRERMVRETLDEYTEMLASEEVTHRLQAVSDLAAISVDLSDPSEALELLEAARRDPSPVVAETAEAAIARELARRGATNVVPPPAYPSSADRLRMEREQIDEYAEMLTEGREADRLRAVQELSAMLVDMIDPSPALVLLETARVDRSETVAGMAGVALAREYARRGDVSPGLRAVVSESASAARDHRVQAEREQIAEHTLLLESDDPAHRFHAAQDLSAMIPDMIDPTPVLALLETATSDTSEAVSILARETVARWTFDRGPAE